MIRPAIVIAALLASVPATAQSAQEALDARHDRALAAGYKALMLCSAIANAERNGAARTAESVAEWELTGIQAPLDKIVGELPFEIVRAPDGQVSHVSVTWDGESRPRFARHDLDRGCHALPVGAEEPANARWHRPEQTTAIVASHPRTEGPLVETGQAAFSESHGDGTRTTAVVIRVDGYDAVALSAEDFPNVSPTPQRTWSVAKSIAATLIGAAAHRGEADVAASAGLGENDGDPRRAITVDHLLRMASGRYSETAGNRTDPLYFGGSTVEETALHWPLVYEPDSVFRYANNETLAAVEAIEDSFARHPPAALFARLGMDHTVAETDWQGSYILSSQVWSTARDLATLGQLYLDGGVLPSGERVLPENWLEYVSTPSGPQPEGAFGYGAGFWLMNKSLGIPPDTIAAMGNRGQFIIIVPKMNVVIVRRGEDPAGSRFDIAAFTRDVLESLRK